MFTSNATQEYKVAVIRMQELTRSSMGSFNYAAGYLGAVAIQMFALLTPEQQKEFQGNMDATVVIYTPEDAE